MADTGSATTYSFFGHLNLSIRVNGHRGYERYFSNEYSRITNGDCSNNSPTITVHIIDRLPDSEPGDLVKTVRYKRLFTYSFLVRSIDTSNVDIYFESHLIDRVYMNAIGVFLQAQVLEPVMYLKLLERNVLLMHAAGVAARDKGYLFPAHGGTGKTTLSIALLDQGCHLLGDDLLFVDVSERRVYAYPRPLHLFTYNVKNLHGARVPYKYRFTIYIKNVIRFILQKVLRTELLISTRVHADELFSNDPYGESVPYHKLCFLVKTGESVSNVDLDDGNVPEVVEEIMQSEDLNDSLYEIIDDIAKISEVQEIERKVIGNLLGHFKTISYVNTRTLDLADLRAFVDDVLGAGALPQGGTEPATA
jgi:hypothetical protein